MATTHGPWSGLLAGDLQGRLPNPKVVPDTDQLTLAGEVFGNRPEQKELVQAGTGVTITRNAAGVVVSASASATPDDADAIIAGRVYHPPNIWRTFAKVLMADRHPDFPNGNLLSVSGTGIGIGEIAGQNNTQIFFFPETAAEASHLVHRVFGPHPTENAAQYVLIGGKTPLTPYGRGITPQGFGIGMSFDANNLYVLYEADGAAPQDQIVDQVFVRKQHTPEIQAGANITITRNAAGPVIASTGGGGGASATTVEVDLGSTPVFAGKFTLTDAAIGASSKVLCWQAPGPYTGKGSLGGAAAMEPVQVTEVVPAAGSATVYWQTPPIVVSTTMGTIGSPLGGGSFGNTGNNRAQPQTARRIGRVWKNIKFSYVVFS